MKVYLQLAFPLSACWHIRNYEGRVWVVTVVLLIYSCSMHHFLTFYGSLKIHRPPLEKQRPAKTRWKICTSRYHWSSLILQENQEEENHGLWFHCKKELSYCNSKGFSSNKTRQVWSCCAASTPRSQGRASHAANAPSSPQGKDHRANRFRPTFLRRAVVQTCPSFLSLPREWEAVRCKDAALARWPFPCLFLSSRRMDSLNAINVLVKPSCLAPCTHSSWQSSVLWTPCGYCVVLSPHLPWRSQSLNHLNSFGAGGLHAGHTAEECRYLGLLWKGPAERSLGCTVLSISLPPPGFGREQIPSRIIGLRSWKVIQILH